MTQALDQSVGEPAKRPPSASAQPAAPAPHILERLRGIAGCAPPARGDRDDRLPLSESGLAGRLDLASFLAVAESLARTVAEIHARGIVHKHINPANILVRPRDRRVQLVGFDLATVFAEERPQPDRLSRLPAVLAYLSPEQTGRMNRPVDYRTDLYSLGATLYALATGAPPFEDTDTLGLIHAHLARSPAPPQTRATWMPTRLSEAILILLAKEPDERYRSAAGLAHDLLQMRRALDAGMPLDAMRLRTRDLPLAPRPPHRLHGRDRELATLTQTFARAVGGESQALFVAGYAGVGKTALIGELQRPATLARGLFLSGKCDQFQRDRPFLAPAQCLRLLSQSLLAAPEATVARWRTRILAGVGADASALFEVVPELEALLGPQPPAPALGPLESQIRLRLLLVALVRQVAAPGHPLVLFLDDLQWADRPSLDLLAALLEDSALRGLMLIGAYRDNEVAPDHPLHALLRRPALPVLRLDSLSEPDLDALLADMLQTPPAQIRPLAAALFAKTGGNPFFTIAFLTRLQREGALRPNPQRGRWEWDRTAILARPASDNVVDFLVAGLNELPEATAESLVAAACLGNELTLGLLALATGVAPPALAERLLPALERGILIAADALAFHRAEPGLALQFCHDRMQQAAYLLRDDAWRDRLHLAMARRFAAAADAALRLRAAVHYAAVASALVDAAECARARDLFLAAAVQTRQAGDFAAAERFVRLGIDRLAADAWEREPAIAFALHAERHLVLYSQGRLAESDAVYARLAAETVSPLPLVEPTCIQIVSLSNRTLYREALALGCEHLARLGLAVPLSDLDRSLPRFVAVAADVFRPPDPPQTTVPTVVEPETAIGRELDRCYRFVAAGAFERLAERHDRADARLAGAANLMSAMVRAAHCSHLLLACWLGLRIGRLWIEDGYCPTAIKSLVVLGAILILLRGDFATAERLATIALKVGAAREGGRETARGLFNYWTFLGHWQHPAEEAVAGARRAFAESLRIGDPAFALFALYASQAALLSTCASLDEMQAENAFSRNFARKIGHFDEDRSHLIYRQLIRALAGKTAAPGSFDDAEFDASHDPAVLGSNPSALCFFYVYRALAACVFQDEAALWHHAEMAVELILGIYPQYPTALVNLLHSLALARRLPETPMAERPALLGRLERNQTWLAARAAEMPANFAHLHDWVEAERLDALDRPEAAYQAYEQAMRKAQAYRRPLHRALIVERAGQCFMRRGLEHAGRSLLAQAYALYRDWGALGKVQAMRASLPFLAFDDRDAPGKRQDETPDRLALLRTSQALASERALPRLVARVVSLMGELTGATDVQLLLLDESGRWHLEGALHGAESHRRMTLEEAQRQRVVAASALRLALKTGTAVVSDDATLDSRLASDPHLAGLSRCALLALPVSVRGRISACLILENRLFRAAFTQASAETLSLLCGQLAISIENARLYRSLEDKVAEREQALKRLYERLTAIEVERSRAQERERLLQDMHDGFGSQLASARLRIERGEIAQMEIKALLQECLDDLYLVIDAMSDEAKSLHEAVVDYRYRCTGRLADAAVRIDWQIALDDCPPIDRRLILQILRILQEALNNALKHARASRIEVHVAYDPAGIVRAAVADNGRGLPETPRYGRGTGNMQSRARDIGARLEWTRLEPGTRVSLTLPLSQDSPASAQPGA